MNVDRYASIILVLLGSAFAICITYLIPHKAPWVDEMYTWHGIHHDHPGQFWKSISSGINYSPPLYFFLNWIWQLFLPLSLNALRVESLLCILAGAGMVYHMLRKQLGSVTALLGVGGVLLQSNLLFGQSMEARSYGLFFFCGAAVLYLGQSLTINKEKRSTWIWAFIAHAALCLTHYFGIVFSGLAALSRYLSIGQSRNRALRTSPEIASWIVSLPVYAILINKQSDHLAVWPRPNEFHNLLASYLDSINPLFFSIPIILILILNPSTKKVKRLLASEDKNKFIFYCSILWVSVPMLIWLLSQLTSLNLFKERYFIPKEASWMVLVALVISRIPFLRSNSRKALLPVCASMFLGVGMLILSTQRKLFVLHPSRNYYHWLIVDKWINDSSLTKVYAGDHLYFPNQKDKEKGSSYLWINNDALLRTYKEFSTDISTIKTQDIIGLKHFILIHDYTKGDFVNALKGNSLNIKSRMSVNKNSKFFADEIQFHPRLLE